MKKLSTLSAALLLFIGCAFAQNPVASFTHSPACAVAGTQVQFTNTSVNYTSVTWDFGDPNSPGTSALNTPTHIYSSGGSYLVTLYASNGTVTDSSIQTINVLSASLVSQTNITCYGGTNGSITLRLNGGATPFLYSDDNGTTFQSSQVFSGLSAGNYNTVIKDNSGCTAGLLVVVTSPAAIQINGTVTDVSCSDSGAVNTSATGGIAPYSYTWSTQANTPNITDLNAGSYAVTLSDANACVATAVYTVNSSGTPTTLINETSTYLCRGSHDTLTATSGNAYTWSTGATTQSIVVNPTSAAVYSVTVDYGTSCTGSDTVSIPVYALPVPQISPGSLALCYGSTQGHFTAGGGVSYLWSTGANTSTISFTAFASNRYSVTVTNNNGCSATTSAQLTVNSNPGANAGQNQNLPNCSPSGLRIGGAPTASGGNGAYQYSWAPLTGLSSSTLSNPVVQGIAANTTYGVTVTDGNTCSATSQVTVFNISNTPSVNINSTSGTAWCAGSVPRDSLSAIVTAGTTPYTTYHWSGTGISPTNAVLGTVGLNTAGNYNYFVTVTDFFNCTATATINIFVKSVPVVSVTANPHSICLNSSTTLGGSPTASGGSGAFSYAWDNGAANTANPVVSPDVTTPYTLTVTDGELGCTATASTTVNVNSNPVANAGGTATLTPCQHQGVEIGGLPTASAGTGPYTYNWAPSTGLSSVTASNPTVDSITSAVTYGLTVTDHNGCTANDVVTVTIANDSLSVTITSNKPTNAWCASTVDERTLTAVPVGGVSPTYHWAGGNGSPISPTTAASGIVSPHVAGSYVYSVTVTDANSCTATASDTITIFPSPVVSAGPVGGFLICANQNKTIGGNPTASGGAGGFKYQWSSNDTIDANPTVSPSGTAIYSVTVTDSRSCSASSSTKVTVDTIVATVSVTTASPCLGSRDTLTVTGGSTYLWSTGDGTATIVVPITGNASYAVTVTDSNQCTGTAGKTITPLSLPPTPASINYEHTVCFNSNFMSFTISPFNPICHYVWDMEPAEPRMIYNDSMSEYSFSHSGSHTLALTITWDNNGCHTSYPLSFTVPVTLAPDSPMIVLTQPGNNLFCLDTTFGTYQWGYDSANVQITLPGENTPFYSQPVDFSTDIRNYWLYVCDTIAGCCTRVYYNYPFYTGINTLTSGQVKVYPNPTGGRVTIAADAMKEFVLYDLAGRYLSKKEAPRTNSMQFDLSAYPAGIYIGEVFYETGGSSKFRIVVER